MNARDKTPRALVADLYKSAQALEATEREARAAKIGDDGLQSRAQVVDQANAAVIVARLLLQREDNR